ncbi:hypothetical protein [Proteiniclasticum ruminis]|uniref:Uncharacterized protein n=1 Tax=Proteiniclasticum ruminis TaxID=398199 RepID=A0A1G8PTM7_9CLOT|nr:hypothetical protein [Proteiniclasticum ruminis]MBP9920622.1 hypothetical protein [Proteiniclasticum sp.]SDI95803.1 hypothetical protein SAMN05421804_105203 [Proteiniclasticum ruminis]
MEEKDTKREKFAKNLGKITSEVLHVSGDAVGLLAMKMGKDAFAYKTIKTMRQKSQEAGDQVERFVDENIQKVQVRIEEQDLKDLRDKVDGVVQDVKDAVKKVDIHKITDQVKEKAESIITKETKIYGDASHFYEEDKKVEGIVIDEVTWKEED